MPSGSGVLSIRFTARWLIYSQITYTRPPSGFSIRKCMAPPFSMPLRKVYPGMRDAAASRKKRSFSYAKKSFVAMNMVGKRETSKSASRTQSAIQVAGSTSMS